MSSRLIALSLLALLAAAASADAGCSVPRAPSDVAALVEAGSIDVEGGEALMPLASRRQGVAASLLELRYSVGKNAAAGGDAAARHIAELRGRIDDRAAELTRLNGEIAALVAELCRGAAD